jgi:hypothetical protein
VIIVEWRVRFDTERDEISMSPGVGFGKKAAWKDAIRAFSISQFRDFAGAVDPKNQLHSEKDESDIIVSPATTQNYYIDIPPYWTKEDLLDLKDYLAKETPWLIPVWIRVSGIEKNTKFSIENTIGLENWIKMKHI